MLSTTIKINFKCTLFIKKIKTFKLENNNTAAYNYVLFQYNK